jgi:hypothetical protein
MNISPTRLQQASAANLIQTMVAASPTVSAGGGQALSSAPVMPLQDLVMAAGGDIAQQQVSRMLAIRSYEANMASLDAQMEVMDAALDIVV